MIINRSEFLKSDYYGDRNSFKWLIIVSKSSNSNSSKPVDIFNYQIKDSMALSSYASVWEVYATAAALSINIRQVNWFILIEIEIDTEFEIDLEFDQSRIFSNFQDWPSSCSRSVSNSVSISILSSEFWTNVNIISWI
jgi:hypothetical protein